MRKFILPLALVCALFSAPGCSLISPKSPVTWEASRFLAFKDVWTTTLAMYDHSKSLYVEGKISDRDMSDIDSSWNTFRFGYLLALGKDGNNTNAFTPDEVRKLANDVLTLIYASQ